MVVMTMMVMALMAVVVVDILEMMALVTTLLMVTRGFQYQNNDTVPTKTSAIRAQPFLTLTVVKTMAWVFDKKRKI